MPTTATCHLQRRDIDCLARILTDQRIFAPPDAALDGAVVFTNSGAYIEYKYIIGRSLFA